MRAIHRYALAALLLTVGAHVVTGCGGRDATKSVGGETLTLRIGTDDRPGRPASNQIEEFARRVDELSNGSLHIQPVWHAAGDGFDGDQRVARMVVAGELDMGLIPSRAWDTEGVTSLRALNAPFLITSDALVDAVITSDLGDALLAGLEGAGVVGLALFPEGLRHTFSFGEPLLGPDDYAGSTIRSPTSATTAALFEALGATVTDSAPGAAMQAGEESSFALAESGSTATGNVTLFPKLHALVVNTDAYEDLTDEQREILRNVAAATRAWAIDTLPTDAEAAEAFCAAGGAVVQASETDIAALEQAAEPVYTDLESDDTTRDLIARIRELATEISVTDTAPRACGERERPSDSSSVAGAATTGTEAEPFPEGAYRTELTRAFLTKRGLTLGDAEGNEGIQTLTFEDGRWSHATTKNPANPPVCMGVYEVDGSRVVLTFDTTTDNCGTAGAVLFSAEWTLRGDVLRFSDVVDDQIPDEFGAIMWGGTPWKKIR